MNKEALEFSEDYRGYKYNCNVAAYFWICSLDGDGEIVYTVEDDGIFCCRFDVTDEERKALGIQWTECFLFEDEQGFVNAQSFVD